MCGVRCAVAATQRAVRVQMCGCWLLEGGCGCTVAPVVDRHGSSLAPARGWADTPSSLFCISAAERAGRPGQQLPGALGACRHNSSSSSSSRQLSGNSGAAEPRASPLDPPKMSENNKKKVKEKNGQPASQARGQALISTATHPHPRSAHSPTHLTSSAAAPPPPPPRLLMRRRRGGGGGRLLLLLPCLAPLPSHPNSNQKGRPPADRSREDRARRSDRPSGVPSGSREVEMDARVARVAGGTAASQPIQFAL